MMDSCSAARQAQVAPRKALRERRFIVLSEHELQAQLDDAISTSTEDSARGGVGQAAIPRIGDGSRRRTRIEMVEGIQKIGAELQAALLRDGDELLHSDIPVPGA